MINVYKGCRFNVRCKIRVNFVTQKFWSYERSIVNEKKMFKRRCKESSFITIVEASNNCVSQSRRDILGIWVIISIGFAEFSSVACAMRGAYLTSMPLPCVAVSYTHLDVYKRQHTHTVEL